MMEVSSGASKQRGFTKLFPSKESSSLFSLGSEIDSAHHIEILEQSGLARVIKYVLKPGEKTGWHHHHLDFLTIQLSEGTLSNHIAKHPDEIATAVGRETHFKPGTVVTHKAPLLHNAMNIGDCDVVAYEVEFLQADVSVRESDFAHLH
jgi:quercetin dioxygenase-like cupin family protein